MLGKLIKHEFKATSRIFLPLYLILVCVTLFGKLIITSGIIRNFEAIEVMLLLVYIFFIFVLFVTTMIYLVMRFYKNLFSDEGYLMFTLPVKPWQLITSKLISAFIWNIGSMILTVMSIVFLVINETVIREVSIAYRIALNYFKTNAGIDIGFIIFWLAAGIIIFTLYQILMVYASIALGQMMGKHRILGAFASFMIIYIIMQVISFAYMAVMGFSNLSETIQESEILFNFYGNIIQGTLLISLVFAVAFYLITNYILNKKLNLE